MLALGAGCDFLLTWRSRASVHLVAVNLILWPPEVSDIIPGGCRDVGGRRGSYRLGYREYEDKFYFWVNVGFNRM